MKKPSNLVLVLAGIILVGLFFYEWRKRKASALVGVESQAGNAIASDSGAQTC